MHDVIFLFDVDNTLIDNDRIQQDLRAHLEESYGRAARERHWAIFDELWAELGYADYIGALERYRAEKLHNPTTRSPSASTPARSTPSHMSGNGVCP